jgi:uncharacterized membrane protein (GlpM family)
VPGIGRLEERDMADLSDPCVDVFYSLASLFIYLLLLYYYYQLVLSSVVLQLVVCFVVSKYILME